MWNRRNLGGEFNSFRFGEKKERGEEEIAAGELRVSMVMKRRDWIFFALRRHLWGWRVVREGLFGSFWSNGFRVAVCLVGFRY